MTMRIHIPHCGCPRCVRDAIERQPTLSWRMAPSETRQIDAYLDRAISAGEMAEYRRRQDEAADVRDD